MRKYLYSFLLLSAHLFSQNIFKGVLIDSITGQAIEFANIGLVAKGFGTVSNEKGEYQFSVPDSAMHSVVKISIIGYHTKTLSAIEFYKKQKVFLRQNATALNEVTVASKKYKIKVLGNETKKSAISAGFGSNNLGCEMAVKLDIKHPQTQIRKFMININKNSLGKTPVFRLNIYNMDKDGMPKENILKQSVIIEPKELTGFLEVDLKPYAVFVDEDVFVSLEWIKDLGPANGLYFSTKVPNGSTYYRLVSQDKWQKRGGVGVGLHVEVAY